MRSRRFYPSSYPICPVTLSCSRDKKDSNRLSYNSEYVERLRIKKINNQSNKDVYSFNVNVSASSERAKSRRIYIAKVKSKKYK